MQKEIPDWLQPGVKFYARIGSCADPCELLAHSDGNFLVRQYGIMQGYKIWTETEMIYYCPVKVDKFFEEAGRLPRKPRESGRFRKWLCNYFALDNENGSISLN